MLENMEKVFEFHKINDRIKESHRTFKKYVTNKNIYYIKKFTRGCPVKNRLEHIREQVKNEKKVTVSELSKIYKVTEETIRRDLEKLEKEGF